MLVARSPSGHASDRSGQVPTYLVSLYLGRRAGRFADLVSFRFSAGDWEALSATAGLNLLLFIPVCFSFLLQVILEENL